MQETHLLVLVPQTVNGRPLNLKSLSELVKAPKQGNPTQYRLFDLGEYPDPPAPTSHWVLMTRDVIPGSRGKSCTNQKALVTSYVQKTGISYQVPNILNAAVTIFMEYVRSGVRLYPDEPLTYTRCQEQYNANWQLVVGGFAAGGLAVNVLPLVLQHRRCGVSAEVLVGLGT